MILYISFARHTSLNEQKEYLGVAQFGSVLEWGSRGRKFESSHPDLKKSLETQVSEGFSFVSKWLTTNLTTIQKNVVTQLYS